MTGTRRKASRATIPDTELVLERYGSALRRYLSRRSGRPQDTADLIQEIFARFLRKNDRPEVLGNPFAYLLGFARNVLREAVSEKQRSRIVYDSDLVDALGEEIEDPALEPLADRLAERQELISALRQLPEAQQLAISLVDGQGMSYEEAARASGFTKSTIATYVMQARASLRQILPAYWSDSQS